MESDISESGDEFSKRVLMFFHIEWFSDDIRIRE